MVTQFGRLESLVLVEPKTGTETGTIGLFFKELGLEVLSKSQELGNTDFILLLLYKAKKEEKQQSPKH